MRGDDGQGLAEYALILALIAIVAIVALLFMGSQVSDKLSVIGSQLQSVAGSPPPPPIRSETRRTIGPAGSSCPAPGHPDAAGTSDANLAADLAPCVESCRFLLMVLALWYSRAAFEPLLQWCHLSHRLRGESTLKRSNRLVLLVGVFLAIVAFVGILLLVTRQRRSERRKPPTTGTVVVAIADIPLSGKIKATDVENQTKDLTAILPGAFTDVSQVDRPDRPPARRDGRPGHR